MQKNSATDVFVASKILRLIRRAVIFPAGFWQTNFRRQIQWSVAVEGSIIYDGAPTQFQKWNSPCLALFPDPTQVQLLVLCNLQ